MKATIDNMLTHVMELEGLLLVMQRHDVNDVPQQVVARFKQLAQIVAQEAQMLHLEPIQQPQVQKAAHGKSNTDDQPAAPAPVPVTATPIAPDSTAITPPVFKPQATAQQSRNVASLLSINDKFLFVRELFDNDIKKFDHTIELIQAMKTRAEVEDLVASKLHWNMENDTVKEFMRIIMMSFPNPHI